MRPYIILAVIGVIVAGLAALAVRSTVAPPAQTEQVSVQTARILIAKADIPIGGFVQPDQHLAWAEWPAEKVQSPPYVVEGGASIADFSGAVARRSIFAGEPISQGAVVKPGEGGFMSAVLQPGKRAVSVPVNATTGNAGFIFPGDSVDLILTHNIPVMGSDSFVSETFVENVRVLAVDQSLDNPENKALLAKTVTLEVSPQQAEAITVALEMGKISLTLRSLAMDDAMTAEKAASPQPVILEGELEGEPAAPGMDYFYPPATASSSPPAQPHGFTRSSDISKLLGNGGEGPARVRVIRGGETKDVEFLQGGQR